MIQCQRKWYVYNTVCEGWYKHLCSVGGWQGTALTHIELCANILMVIMEQVGLFNLNKHSNMALKTGQCTPSKKYQKPPSIVWVIFFECDILCMLYVVFVIQCEYLSYCFTCTLYLCTVKSLWPQYQGLVNQWNNWNDNTHRN